MTPDRQIRAWKMKPTLQVLSYDSMGRGAPISPRVDLDGSYLRQCVREHQAHPGDILAAERLAEAYVAAGRRLLAAGENDRAFIFAVQAYSVMNGKCSRAEALMSDIRKREAEGRSPGSVMR